MLALNNLKYRVPLAVLAAIIFIAGVDLPARAKTGTLRIVYGGGLAGKIEPCG